MLSTRSSSGCRSAACTSAQAGSREVEAGSCRLQDRRVTTRDPVARQRRPQVVGLLQHSARHIERGALRFVRRLRTLDQPLRNPGEPVGVLVFVGVGNVAVLETRPVIARGIFKKTGGDLKVRLGIGRRLLPREIDFLLDLEVGVLRCAFLAARRSR